MRANKPDIKNNHTEAASAPPNLWRYVTIFLSATAVGVILYIACVSLIDWQWKFTRQETLDLIRNSWPIALAPAAAITASIAIHRQQLSAREDHRRQQENDREKKKAEAEMFIKIVEQLGSDQHKSRIAAMYGLENFATSHPDYQQRAADILCATLRSTPRTEVENEEETIERDTAQNILEKNLDSATYKFNYELDDDIDELKFDRESAWQIDYLNLAGATLRSFKAIGFKLHKLNLASAKIVEKIKISHSSIQFLSMQDIQSPGASVEIKYCDLVATKFWNSSFQSIDVGERVRVLGEFEHHGKRVTAKSSLGLDGVRLSGGLWASGDFDGTVDLNRAVIENNLVIPFSTGHANLDDLCLIIHGNAIRSGFPHGKTIGNVQLPNYCDLKFGDDYSRDILLNGEFRAAGDHPWKLVFNTKLISAQPKHTDLREVVVRECLFDESYLGRINPPESFYNVVDW